MAEKKDIGLLLKMITENLDKKLNTYLTTLGLTASQGRVLFYLQTVYKGKTTQKAIEDYLDVSHPTTTGIIKRLEDKGFVKTQINVTSRISKDVEITKTGLAVLKETGKSRGIMEKLLSSNLTAAERNTLISLLDKVYNTVSQSDIIS